VASPNAFIRWPKARWPAPSISRNFGSDVTQLRKRLRATAGVTLHDSFPAYGADFRRRFGSGSEQAMDLFH